MTQKGAAVRARKKQSCAALRVFGSRVSSRLLRKRHGTRRLVSRTGCVQQVSPSAHGSTGGL